MRLSEAFFNEIIRHPVPLDLTTLKALKRSPLGLDLYLWLTYRMFALTTPQRLSWKQMYRQFGAHPDKASDNDSLFKTSATKVLRELKKIKLAWPELELRHASGPPDPASFGPAHFPRP